MSTDLAPVEDRLKAAQEDLANKNLTNARLAAGTIALLIEEAAQEALISKDISYVTETYVPERLEEGDFLD